MKSVLFVTALLFSMHSFASAYKCEDKEGQFSYQQNPCGDDQEEVGRMKTSKSESMKNMMDTIEKLKIYSTSRTYTYVVAECKKLSPEIGEKLEKRFEEWATRRQTEIDAGKNIVSQGFDGNSPDELEESFDVKGREAAKELSILNKNELSEKCNKYMQLLDLY